MSIQQAFDSFMSTSFQDAVISSTKASYGGSGYSVELFEDGTFRVLWNNQIGNLYDSPGVILRVPYLSDDEIDEEAEEYFFDNAEEEMRDRFKAYQIESQEWEQQNSQTSI